MTTIQCFAHLLETAIGIGTESETGSETENETGSENKGCPGGKTFQSGGDPPDQTIALILKKKKDNDENCPVVVVVAETVVVEESGVVAVGVGNESCKEGVRRVSECARGEGRALHPTKMQKKIRCCRSCASRALGVGSRTTTILKRTKTKKESNTKNGHDHDHDCDHDHECLSAWCAWCCSSQSWGFPGP